MSVYESLLMPGAPCVNLRGDTERRITICQGVFGSGGPSVQGNRATMRSAQIFAQRCGR